MQEPVHDSSLIRQHVRHARRPTVFFGTAGALLSVSGCAYVIVFVLPPVNSGGVYFIAALLPLLISGEVFFMSTLLPLLISGDVYFMSALLPLVGAAIAPIAKAHASNKEW